MNDWKPRTELGKKVFSGEITSLDEVFERGMTIKEPEIVDRLLPNLAKEIIFMGGSPGKGGGVRRTSTRRTARMHRSGRRYRISACVVVGSPGFLGMGKATGTEHSVAIEKALQAAKLNIIPIKRGCGSWECGCGGNHSIPIKISGKSCAITVELYPAPKGLGLCIGGEMRKLLQIAGIEDIWSKVFGDTRTRLNYAIAIFNAFKNLNKIKIDFKKSEAKTKEEKWVSEKKLKDVLEEEIKKDDDVSELLEELDDTDEIALTDKLGKKEVE
ncbi:30S ribosomal protein S5 [Candidatus Woesearchaeota archaeon]|nr:30S ribosomal protein S5 [Candidatus Woesearchaeota archaeon]